MAIAFLCLAVFLGIAAVHPFVTYPLSLMLAKRLFGRRWLAAPKPEWQPLPGSCAICLCAYNEARSIRDRMQNLLEIGEFLAQEGIDFSIHVYADKSTDDTASILKSYGDKIHLIAAEERTGKSTGLNILLKHVQTPFVVFTDANIMFHRDAVLKLLKRFSDPSVGCVVGQLKYTNEKETPTAKTNSSYWRFEESLKQLESDTGSVMGADGAIYAIRRAVYHDVPADSMDDLYISVSVLCDGYRIVREEDAIAFERTVTSPQDQYRRRVRIGSLNFCCFLHLWPRLIRLNGWNLYRFFSHRLLRWMVMFWILSSILFFTLAVFLFSKTLGFYLLLILGAVSALSVLLSKSRPFRLGISALGTFWATGVGVLFSILGIRFQSWEPPASAR